MSNLTVWRSRDPFADFDSLVRRTFGPVTHGSLGFVPAAEVERDGDDAVVRLELPGLDVAKDVTVEVDRGRLVVRGERRDERSDKAEGRIRSEVRYGSFRRVFGLPKQVTAEAISASYDAGVLTVRVAGAYAGSEPQKIAIESPSAN
jgi:HSP20 family molecular chaperone IbpA